MKYFTFFRESDTFDDILSDINIKKHISEKIRWKTYLRIGISDYKEEADKIFFYITLKYGDDIRSDLTKDYRPIANVDYTPIRK